MQLGAWLTDIASPTPIPSSVVLASGTSSWTLSLPSNPTTGYQWQLVALPTNYIELVEHHYVPSDTRRIGAGNYEVWEFHITPAAYEGSRAFILKMHYARPWEKTDSDVKTILIITQP